MTTNATTAPNIAADPADYKSGRPLGGCHSTGLGRHAVVQSNANYRGASTSRIYGSCAVYISRCGRQVRIEDNARRYGFDYKPFQADAFDVCKSCVRLIAKDAAKLAAAQEPAPESTEDVMQISPDTVMTADEFLAAAADLGITPTANIPEPADQDAPTAPPAPPALDLDRNFVWIDVPGTIDRWLEDCDRLDFERLPHDTPDYQWRHAIRTGRVLGGRAYRVQARMSLRAIQGMIEELEVLADLEAAHDPASRMIRPSVIRAFIARARGVMPLA